MTRIGLFFVYMIIVGIGVFFFPSIKLRRGRLENATKVFVIRVVISKYAVLSLGWNFEAQLPVRSSVLLHFLSIHIP